MLPLISFVLSLLAPPRAPLPHDLDRTNADVYFFPDHTFQIDLYNPVDWLLVALEPLSQNPSPTLLTGEAREKRLGELTGTLAQWLWVMFDGTAIEVHPEYISKPYGEQTDSTKPQLGLMRIRGTVPEGAKQFSFAYGIANDAYPLFVMANDSALTQIWVSGPAESEKLDIASLTPRSLWGILRESLKVGFTHVLPKGVEYILLVLGIVLVTARLGPMLTRVTTFTLAHAAAFALTLFGVVALKPTIVGPLVALSLVYVALENLLRAERKPVRNEIVFGLGLLYGMGLAGVLAQLGLRAGDRVPGLVGFNVGVACGLLAVVGVAFLLFGWLRRKAWYRQRVVVPVSLAIAVAGVVLTVTRALGG